MARQTADRICIGKGSTMKTREFLNAAGPLLFGENWKAQIALATGWHAKTIARYAAGRRPVPDDLTARLVELIVDRRRDLKDLLDRAAPEA